MPEEPTGDQGVVVVVPERCSHIMQAAAQIQHQSIIVDNIPECDEYLFWTEYEYRILFGFQKSPNTEYRILFGIEKIRIPNTEYYSVSRKSEYRIQIVLFGLTNQIPYTKYRIVYKILEKRQLKSKYLSHTRHLVLKICETIRTDIWTGI